MSYRGENKHTEKQDYPKIDTSYGPGAYALRVEGDSMVDAGILDGDYIIVRKQNTAGNAVTAVSE